MLFDQPYYLEINEARWATASAILSSLPPMNTCIDAGCGPGWFSSRLLETGLSVFGFDGRHEIVEEARKRAPGALFSTLDITSRHAADGLPVADLVFCFGLLYHLENPFAAIRGLHGATRRFMLIETQIAPESGPACRLVSEGNNETQGLTYHALIPSRSVLVKMLYVAGYKSVLRYTGRTNHPDFYDTEDKLHRREIFLASRVSVDIQDFVQEFQPHTPKIDYGR